MKSVPELYSEAELILSEYNKLLSGYENSLKNCANAEINLDSVRAKVSATYDSGTISKAALKETVAGDKEVLDAKAILLKWQTKVKIDKEKMEYFDKCYTLCKKGIDAITKEIQHIGAV